MLISQTRDENLKYAGNSVTLTVTVVKYRELGESHSDIKCISLTSLKVAQVESLRVHLLCMSHMHIFLDAICSCKT